MQELSREQKVADLADELSRKHGFGQLCNTSDALRAKTLAPGLKPKEKRKLLREASTAQHRFEKKIGITPTSRRSTSQTEIVAGWQV